MLIPTCHLERAHIEINSRFILVYFIVFLAVFCATRQPGNLVTVAFDKHCFLEAVSETAAFSQTCDMHRIPVIKPYGKLFVFLVFAV